MSLSLVPDPNPFVDAYTTAAEQQKRELREALDVVEAENHNWNVARLYGRDELRWALDNLGADLAGHIATLTATYAHSRNPHGTADERLQTLGQLGGIYSAAAHDLRRIVHTWIRRGSAGGLAGDASEGANDMRTSLVTPGELHEAMTGAGMLDPEVCPSCGAPVPAEVPLAGGGIIRQAVDHRPGCTLFAWRAGTATAGKEQA